METCWIGLGGNVGDVPQTFAAVAAELQQRPEISDLRSSGLYRSAPMGADAGDPFWNAVIGFQTSDEPSLLWQRLQELESQHARVRTIHWGPRTLDLDILYIGDRLIETPQLRVPHPGRVYRRFVLDPLCELAPTWVDPEFRLQVQDLRERLVRMPRVLAISPEFPAAVASAVIEQLRERWPDVILDRSGAPTKSSLVVTYSFQTTIEPALVVPEDLPEGQIIALVLDAATAAFEPPLRLRDGFFRR